MQHLPHMIAPVPSAVESWRDIPGYGGRYQASDWGRVRSVDRVVEYVNAKGTTVRCRRRGCVLRPGRMPNGHYTVVLDLKSVLVQHCILSAFKGPRPEGQEALHLNGDSACNLLGNLAWGTHPQNMRHRKWHGGPTGRNKLRPDDVVAIRDALARGDRTTDEIGVAFGVSGRTVRYIRSGRDHVDVPS